jgi:hypothetical protein
VRIVFKPSRPAPEDASTSLNPGVSVRPGLTAFTRMRRCFKSVVQVRAKERTAALVALETLPAPNPLLAPMAAFRMIEALSFLVWPPPSACRASLSRSRALLEAEIVALRPPT